MAMSGGRDDGAPMMEMNMTPLIDVLLVLLIVFIMSIPIATHSVDIDLPVPDPNPPADMVDPIKNKIVLTPANEILWNGDADHRQHAGGEPADLADLSRSSPSCSSSPKPHASYDLSAKVLNIIKASGVTKFGFVGNEKYRVFDKA